MRTIIVFRPVPPLSGHSLAAGRRGGPTLSPDLGPVRHTTYNSLELQSQTLFSLLLLSTLCLALADRRREAAYGHRSYHLHHHLDVDCLRYRPLGRGASLTTRSNFGPSSHRDTNTAATVQSSLHCTPHIRVVSYDFPENTLSSVAVRKRSLKTGITP